MCSNVCIHVGAKKGICVHVEMCVRRLQFAVTLQLILFEAGLSIRPKLTESPNLTSQLPPETLFQRWSVRGVSMSPSIYVGSRDLYSSPLACLENALTAEPCPPGYKMRGLLLLLTKYQSKFPSKQHVFRSLLVS